MTTEDTLCADCGMEQDNYGAHCQGFTPGDCTEPCEYHRTDLRDSCPKHERNREALIRRYVTEEVNCAETFGQEETPLPEFRYSFPRKRLSSEFMDYRPLERAVCWSFDHTGVRLLYASGCGSDFEHALVLTMPDGGAEMYELNSNQHEMLTHHTGQCRCVDKESHDGLCRLECIEASGMPRRCHECGDRHCNNCAEECCAALEGDEDDSGQ